MKKGLFITFEGGEGAGKTTLISNIEKKLQSQNYSTLLTIEPGGTAFGDQMRQIILEKRKDTIITPYAELCLYLASRSQHIKDVIKPALSDNKIVLCDRFNDSSIVYQGHARGLGMEKVTKFCNFISENLMPDLTIYLDIDPKIGLSRLQGEKDRLESEKLIFHEKIREGFHLLLKNYPQRIKKIDASLSIDEVFTNAMQFIEDVIK